MENSQHCTKKKLVYARCEYSTAIKVTAIRQPFEAMKGILISKGFSFFVFKYFRTLCRVWIDFHNFGSYDESNYFILFFFFFFHIFMWMCWRMHKRNEKHLFIAIKVDFNFKSTTERNYTWIFRLLHTLNFVHSTKRSAFWCFFFSLGTIKPWQNFENWAFLFCECEKQNCLANVDNNSIIQCSAYKQTRFLKTHSIIQMQHCFVFILKQNERILKKNNKIISVERNWLHFI